MNLNKFDRIDNNVLMNKNNIKKMTILEYCYLYIFNWKNISLKYNFLNPLKDLVVSFITLILNMVFIITLPIHLPITAHKEIKKARR